MKPPARLPRIVPAAVALLLAGGLRAAPETGAPPVRVDASRFPTLQAALDAVPASGGLVVLPPGTHEIAEPLRVGTAETRIVGAGPSTRIVNRNTAGAPAWILRPPGIETNRKAELWRVEIANLRISGTTNSGDGILAHRIQELFLHGVSIDRNGGNGIHLVDCFEDARVADCIVTYNGASGLRITNGHDIVVSANQFEENLDAVVCLDSFNLCMTGNNVDDHLRHGVVIENTYGSIVTGNMIEECNGTAVILDRDCYGIAMSANVIAHHLGGGIDLRDAWGCAVSANTFTIAHGFSVRVGPGAGRTTISGNSVCNTHIGGADKRPATGRTAMSIDEGAGILLDGATDVTIGGNTFGGLSTPAVWTTNACRRILVRGNLVTDCCRKQPGAPAIDLRAAAESVATDNLP